MADTILRLNAVRQRCGLSRTAIYSAIQRADFPRQVQLTARSVGWRASAIEAWIAARTHKPNSTAAAAMSLHDRLELEQLAYRWDRALLIDLPALSDSEAYSLLQSLRRKVQAMDPQS